MGRWFYMKRGVVGLVYRAGERGLWWLEVWC